MLLLVLALATARDVGRRFLRAEPALDLDLCLPDELRDGGDGDVELAADLLAGANGTVFEQLNRTGYSRPRADFFGLFNTGTNLLHALVTKNMKEDDMAKWELRGPKWKHAKPEILYANFPWLKPKASDVFVGLLRNPMSWLQSMRKAPYNLQSCTVGSSWTTQSCKMSCDKYCLLTHRTAKSWPNIEAVWNTYAQDYAAALRYGYGKVVLIRYEDLVTQPEVELQKIAHALGIPLRGTLTQQHAPAKKHGLCAGRQAALAKLRSKSYLGLYQARDRARACGLLTRPTMHARNYHDCDGW